MSSQSLPRFEIGYQASPGDGTFPSLVEQFHRHIDTVYFPWVFLPSGRAPLGAEGGGRDWTAQRRLEEDLTRLKEMGVRLNLLLNASCYGSQSVSRSLSAQIHGVLDHLVDIGAAADIVTTCSPFLAEMIRKRPAPPRLRASVNMGIGTVAGMEYLADLFDDYNIRKECNRDFPRLEELRAWADRRGKELIPLINSGCLSHCSSQTFHDNLVAHEGEICTLDNVPGWAVPTCRRLLRSRSNWRYVLQGTWVRPEDLHHWGTLFPVVKLATRMHQNPWLVLHAYTRQSHPGAVTDLLEPGFSGELAPQMLDNRLFPADWFERTSRCGHDCGRCNYCTSVLDQVVGDAWSV